MATAFVFFTLVFNIHGCFHKPYRSQSGLEPLSKLQRRSLHRVEMWFERDPPTRSVIIGFERFSKMIQTKKNILLIQYKFVLFFFVFEMQACALKNLEG